MAAILVTEVRDGSSAPGVLLTSYYQDPKGGGQPQAPHSVSEDRVRLLMHEAINTALKERDERLMRSIGERIDRLAESFVTAFPNNDPVAHRALHDREIQAAQGWAKLKHDALSKVLTGGVWAALMWLVMVAWQAVTKEVSK